MMSWISPVVTVSTALHSSPVNWWWQQQSAVVTCMQVKADFLAGPERPATPRGSQSAKEAASGATKAGACNTVSVPGEALAQPRLQVCWG